MEDPVGKVEDAAVPIATDDPDDCGSSTGEHEQLPKPKQLMLTVVKAIDGSMVTTVDVDADIQVEKLCELLETKCGAPALRMRLLEGEQVLSWRQTLRSLGIASGTQLQLVMESHLHVDEVGNTYLSLHGVDSNFSSSYGWKGGVTSRTIWEKVRFNPETLQVHTGDFKYATVEVQQVGQRGGNDPNAEGLLEVPPGKWTPFATCLDCSAPHSNRAVARIDLRGTPYKVPQEAFAHSGYLSAGSWTYTENGQVVDLCGGGYCGWTAPKLAVDAHSVDEKPGGWFLQLVEV